MRLYIFLNISCKIYICNSIQSINFLFFFLNKVYFLIPFIVTVFFFIENE